MLTKLAANARARQFVSTLTTELQRRGGALAVRAALRVLRNVGGA